MQKFKSAIIFSTLTMASAYGLLHGGVGHYTTMNEITASSVTHVDFTKENQVDFNRDGVFDRLICNNVNINNQSRINVRIINGKTGLDLYKWNGYDGQVKGGDGRVQKLTSCDIVYLRPNYPSLVLSNAYEIPNLGYRGFSRQYVIQNISSQQNQFLSKIQTIKIPGTDSNFASAARNVKCSQVTPFYKNRGYADGAYCFYAGYDGALTGGGSGTATAFVKFQHGSNNSLIVKDLTNSSGLMWTGGMRGTNLNRIPSGNLCSGAAKYDGLHMMGSAFIDYDQNGIQDLISIGQHASLRLHKMIFDSSRSEGVRFETSILDPQSSGMTEYLRIQSFVEDEDFAKSNCVYISGERGGCMDTPDHFRCFKDGSWQTFYPAGDRFSSSMGTLTIKATGQGSLAFKVPTYNGNTRLDDKYFSVGGAFERVLKLAVPTNASVNSANVVVRGWACVPNTRWTANIIISTKKYPSESGYREYYRSRTNINTLSDGLKKVCLQPSDVPLIFQAVIPKDQLERQSGKLYVRADMNHMDAGVSKVYREVNY